MIDYSFMSGNSNGQAQQMQQFQQASAKPTTSPMQPTPVGPVAQIPSAAITPQNSGGIADALMSGASDPVATGNENSNSIMDKFGGKSGASFMLASIGQALSAKDPSSWQHQLSGAVKTGAANQMNQRGMLIAALQQKIGAATSNTKSPLTKTKSKYNLETPKLQTLPTSALQLEGVL